MNILIAPHPILEQVAEIIEDIAKYKDLALKVKAYCENTDNVGGLAFPQIGVSKRAFVILTLEGYEIVINPEILWKSDEMFSLEGGEGCLSIPGIAVEVERHQQIRVRYTTIEGEQKAVELDGFWAVLFQHEYDHLDGILITNKQ